MFLAVRNSITTGVRPLSMAEELNMDRRDFIKQAGGLGIAAALCRRRSGAGAG